MARRGQGEGTIYKRADGRWEAALRVAGGKRKRFYGRTRREVQDALALALRDRQMGLPPLSVRQTLGQFLLHWLDNTARVAVRPRTFVRYRELVTLHLMPTLGKRPLVKLTPQDLQTLYSGKLKQGLSPRTVGHIHRLLHRALADALRWGLVARNVCDLVSPPRVARQEMQALAPEQIKALLAVARDDPLEALYVLALTTGMRQGELVGLKWQDVDLAAGALQVRRTLLRVRGQGFVEQEPKSAKGRRTIILTPIAVDALKRHRQRQIETRLLTGPEWEDRDLVLCNSLGRPLEVPNVLRRSFLPLLERAGLTRIRFHDLRHSAATLLLSLGVHPKVVQETLGHSQIGVTMDTYSHVMPSMQAEAASRVQEFLQGKG